jgi:hypothetical protein
MGNLKNVSTQEKGQRKNNSSQRKTAKAKETANREICWPFFCFILRF